MSGELKVKFAVQQRTLHAHHMDAHYMACFWKMMKELGQFAHQTIAKHTSDDAVPARVGFRSMDDKAKVHIDILHCIVDKLILDCCS